MVETVENGWKHLKMDIKKKQLKTDKTDKTFESH